MAILDFQYMLDSAPQILKGVPVSIMVATIAVFFGLLIGFFLALARVHKTPIFNKIAGVYISFFRGTPLLVQIFLCYYGIPILLRQINDQFNFSIDISQIPAIVFAYISFSLNVSAYFAETIRGAILAVPKGQIEAAQAIGMNGVQTTLRIVVPQALVIALPNFSNIIISTLKNTSLAFTVSVPEIIGEAKIIAGRTSNFFEVYIIAALIYWVLCIFLEQAFKLIEKRINARERKIIHVANKTA